MNYLEMLEKLSSEGIKELGRWRAEGNEYAYLGRPEQNVVPFAGVRHYVLLDRGNASVMDDEVFDSILRRCGTRPAAHRSRGLGGPTKAATRTLRHK